MKQPVWNNIFREEGVLSRDGVHTITDGEEYLGNLVRWVSNKVQWGQETKAHR